MKIREKLLGYLKNTDMFLLLTALTCSIYGICLIYSATLTTGQTKYVAVQSIATVIGIAVFVVMSLIEFEAMRGWWRAFYIINIILQLPLFFAKEVNGQRAWLPLGPVSVQPGELGKLLFIFTFASRLSELKEDVSDPRGLLNLGGHALLMMVVIIVTSKDSGMAIQYFMIALVMMFAAGLSFKWIGAGIGIGIASIPLLWNFIMHDYQKNRILVLFEPSLDADLSRQTTNGKIAIGSGQLLGQGLTKGTMTQMNYVLEKRTDYIYAVAGEELGFIGSMAIILLLTTLILRVFYLSYKSSSRFSSMLAIGIGGMFMFQTFMNIFMCIGLLPIMGLTLPLFSYGGTSVTTMYAALGMAAGVRIREKPTRLTN